MQPSRFLVWNLIAALGLGGSLTAQTSVASKGQGGPSVYTRRLKPPEPPTGLDWDARITALLREDPGDIVLTAVGDMIFNEPITHLTEPERRGIFRILQEADVAYGNLEFSINDRPELQRPFYNFRAEKAFAWELARTGINLVSMANNHALDFGPEGLKECLRNLDLVNIDHAGAGHTLAEAHAPAFHAVQGQHTKFGLLSYMRYWSAKYRSKDPAAPSLATIDPAVILVMQDGKVQEVEGPMKADVEAREDDILLARRRADVLMVSLHNHDVSHHRVFGIQDRTPPNDEIMFRKAIDAGADLVLGSGPHVLRGIEIYKGKPIFYSLSDFIYQYRTPNRIPVDLIHQR
ncbi:MAG: CapA family protein, partial [Firmicutes bacterium]|nr:CapA family protein [Bacillota bacterium]